MSTVKMSTAFEKIRSNSFLYDTERLEIAPGKFRWFRKDGTYLARNRWTKGALHSTGYYLMSNNMLRVHRMIAFCFVHNPCPELFDIIDHIDGNPKNNHYTNLRWVDRQLNGMWRHHVKSKFVKNVVRKNGKTYVYWKWMARTRFEGVQVTKFFDNAADANAYLETFRISEFKRIYDRKVKEYAAEKKRRLGYFC